MTTGAWTTTKAFLVVAAGGAALSGSVAWGHPIWSARWALLWRLGLWSVVWVIGVVFALRLRGRRAGVLIVGAGLALRLAALAGPPTTSDDLYRYAWDGRMQQAGIDPYAAAPASTQLTRFHDGWLWPGPTVCAAQHDPPGCTRINRPAARTIYPPVAEFWFASVYRLGGLQARHKAWQIAGVCADAVTMALLVVALRRWQRDPRWLALYALAPYPVLEFVNNGHVDALAVALMTSALVVAAPARDAGRRDEVRSDVLLGLLIGAAALVKVYPGLLLLAVPCLPRTRPWRSFARASVAAGVLAVAAYLPHVVAVGTRVVGYLPGYLREEHYNSGGRFLLAGLLHVPGPAAAAMVAAGIAGAAAVVVWRRPPFPTAAVTLLVTLLLATTPVQPWYGVAVVALAAVCAEPWWAVAAVAGYPYFFAILLGDRHATGIGQAGYGLALVAIVLASRRRPVRWSRAVRPTPLAAAVGVHP